MSELPYVLDTSFERQIRMGTSRLISHTRHNSEPMQIQIQKMSIAIIHNMNTQGKSCIGSLHQVTLQNTIWFST